MVVSLQMLLANNLLVVGNNLAPQTWLCSNANRESFKMCGPETGA